MFEFGQNLRHSCLPWGHLRSLPNSKNDHFFLMTITANYGPVEKFFIFCCLEQKTRPRFLRNWHFFFTFLAPEKPRHVTLILHSLRWGLSWIRSIAGAGNDLGKRANLNFPYTLGGFLKSVLVVSFTLENGVFDKFSMTSFQKPQLHWSALIFINVLLRSTKENAYYSSLVPAGFTMSRGYCSGWHTISRFGRHLGLTGWLPYL